MKYGLLRPAVKPFILQSRQVRFLRRKPLTKILAVFAVGVCSAAVLAKSIVTNLVIPQSMPGGYAFPTPGYVIEQWVKAGNTTAIRGHGWDVWSAMTATSNQSYQGQALPVWDTWLSDVEVFGPQPQPATVLMSGKLRAMRAMHAPHQFTHKASALTAEDADEVLISFNKFDPSASVYLLTPQQGAYNTGPYMMNSLASLEQLNAAWPANTPVGTRAIPDFPATAIETKPVFFPIKAAQLTAVPYWKGIGGATNATNPTPDTWKTCVLIDPASSKTSGLRAATQAEINSAYVVAGYACQTYLYAPMGMAYAVKLDATAAQYINNENGNSIVSAGDYAMLVAMHVNTKEQDPWTWQTFYWQGNSTQATNWPGSLTGQPSSLKSPWTSYAMCTAYSQTDTQGKMNVCFNPYLETSPNIPDGIQSNCVTCHGSATIGKNGTTAPYPANYAQPIAFDDPSIFGGFTKTDFSWAVAGGGSGLNANPPAKKSK